MTHSPTIEQPEDGGAAVDDSQDGAVVEDVAGAATATRHLDAIQHRYEEAKASIVDPSRSPSSSAPCSDGPLPETGAIDLGTLPPVPLDALPGTEAMTLAARSLAERMVAEEVRPPAGGAPSTQFHGNFAVDSPGRRRWWRGLRTARHGGGAGRP